MRIEVVRSDSRLRELMNDHGGYFYSDTWGTLHPSRCGALLQLKPTEDPPYDFEKGEYGPSGMSRGVVAYFHGTLEEAIAWLKQHRNDTPDDWKLCKSCEALVKENPGS